MIAHRVFAIVAFLSTVRGDETKPPTFAPTPFPTRAPTPAPTPSPTRAPTPAPTAAPTPAPTAAPTPAPTLAPTAAPTPAPTIDQIRNECAIKYGLAPEDSQCDTWDDMGDNSWLLNNGNMLNTEDEQLGMPNLPVVYNPVYDAFCFNEDYPVPSYSAEQQKTMYNHYKLSFDEGLADFTDISVENNGVTNNRIPGMFLRMCFHDNTILTSAPKFQDYVTGNINAATGQWTGPFRYMETSGGDASNLICEAERLHPNNDYDNTASRVVNSLQMYLKTVYPELSYADLLHNGCKAATLYLTEADEDTFLSQNPFNFGRKDACHVDALCGRRYPLCGPSEILPGVGFTAPAFNDWFVSRGMNECLWISTMWTHTTMDNMASMCPITKLPCTTTADDVEAFLDTGRLFFGVGDELDYFDFFLEVGSHVTQPIQDPEAANCDWTVDGVTKPWPMTAADCSLGLDIVQANGLTALASAITNFHTPSYNTVDILGCALAMLSGNGYKEGGICDLITPTECQSPNEHMFGSFYSTLPPPTSDRVTIDPICEEYGYRRRRLFTTSTENMADHRNCTKLDYDMYLVVEGAHFAGLATPKGSNHGCPPVVLHSAKTKETQEPQKIFSIPSMWDVNKIDTDAKLHVGTRPLEVILEAFESVDVGLKGQKFYDPVTNNCVALMRNMADPLDVELDDRLVNFIARNLMKESADQFFDAIADSSTLTALYSGGHRFLKGVGKEEILAKLIKYYL